MVSTCWNVRVLVAGEGRGTGPREHAHVTGTREVMGSVKAAKAAARGFRESGVKPREAAKAALTATGAVRREKQKKRKKPESHPESDDGPGFKAPRKSHVYAGTALLLNLTDSTYSFSPRRTYDHTVKRSCLRQVPSTAHNLVDSAIDTFF